MRPDGTPDDRRDPGAGGARAARGAGDERSALAAVLRQLDALGAATSLPEPVGERLRDLVIHLSGDSLAQPVAERFRGLSRINANGLPFQWSVCLDDGPPSVRFLCECGVPGSDPELRCAQTLERFREACVMCGAGAPAWPLDEMVASLLPEGHAYPTGWGSAIWLAGGAGPRGIGLKIYVCLERDDAWRRWRRFGRLLQALGRDASLERLCELSVLASSGSWPVAVGIDALPGGEPGRLKLYFRNADVSRRWLPNWYRSVGAEAHLPAVEALLECSGIAGRVRHPARTFFLSVEFGPGSDTVTLKTDVAICRWMRDDRLVAERVTALASRLGLSPAPYASALNAIGVAAPDASRERRERATHQLIGVGFETGGERHVNVYCKPPLDAGLDTGLDTGTGGGAASARSLEV